VDEETSSENGIPPRIDLESASWTSSSGRSSNIASKDRNRLWTTPSEEDLLQEIFSSLNVEDDALDKEWGCYIGGLSEW